MNATTLCIEKGHWIDVWLLTVFKKLSSLERRPEPLCQKTAGSYLNEGHSSNKSLSIVSDNVNVCVSAPVKSLVIFKGPNPEGGKLHQRTSCGGQVGDGCQDGQQYNAQQKPQTVSQFSNG